MGRVDHQSIRLACFAGEKGEGLLEHTHATPPDEAVVERLVPAVRLRRVLPYRQAPANGPHAPPHSADSSRAAARLPGSASSAVRPAAATIGTRWCTGELAAIPVLLARLAEQDGLRGALVSIDAITTNGSIATAIRTVGADYLLAVKANQPSLRAEVEACFTAAPSGTVETHTEHDKGHGRIEQRTTSAMREVGWLSGERRFPGELRLPDAASIVRVEARMQRGEKTHAETRYYISSARLTAEAAGRPVRGHWRIENRLHWVLDVTFNDDQSRLRKGFGAKNMAVVRHFALNLVRAAKDKKSVKLRRKVAGWDTGYLDGILNEKIS